MTEPSIDTPSSIIVRVMMGGIGHLTVGSKYVFPEIYGTTSKADDLLLRPDLRIAGKVFPVEEARVAFVCPDIFCAA